jgi:hypothetical protein
MKTKIRHQLTGYDRKTDVLAVEYDLDPDIFDRIRVIAEVDPQDPDAIGSYPLSASQLRAMTALLGRAFDDTRYAFFLEPVADPGG